MISATVIFMHKMNLFIHLRYSERNGWVAVEDPLTHEAARICQLMNVDIQFSSGIWSFRKKRKITLPNRATFYKSLNINVSFYGIEEGGAAVNIAEVYLLKEEVPIFTLALRQQKLLFPTNYLQQLTIEREMCCLQLESYEPAGHFVERLCEAFQVLKQQMPMFEMSS